MDGSIYSEPKLHDGWFNLNWIINLSHWKICLASPIGLASLGLFLFFQSSVLSM